MNFESEATGQYVYTSFQGAQRSLTSSFAEADAEAWPSIGMPIPRFETSATTVVSYSDIAAATSVATASPSASASNNDESTVANALVELQASSRILAYCKRRASAGLSQKIYVEQLEILAEFTRLASQKDLLLYVCARLVDVLSRARTIAMSVADTYDDWIEFARAVRPIGRLPCTPARFQLPGREQVEEYIEIGDASTVDLEPIFSDA